MVSFSPAVPLSWLASLVEMPVRGTCRSKWFAKFGYLRGSSVPIPWADEGWRQEGHSSVKKKKNLPLLHGPRGICMQPHIVGNTATKRKNEDANYSIVYFWRMDHNSNKIFPTQNFYCVCVYAAKFFQIRQQVLKFATLRRSDDVLRRHYCWSWPLSTEMT